MEESIDRVAKHCGQELDTFQRCVLAHRSSSRSSADLESACGEHRRRLTACAAQAVPLLRTLKQRCRHQLESYDACLARHNVAAAAARRPGQPPPPPPASSSSSSSSGEQTQAQADAALEAECTPYLRRLWQCTEAVKRELEVEEARARQAAAPV